jgi:hypothetical protein
VVAHSHLFDGEGGGREPESTRQAVEVVQRVRVGVVLDGRVDTPVLDAGGGDLLGRYVPHEISNVSAFFRNSRSARQATCISLAFLSDHGASNVVSQSSKLQVA